METLSTAKHRAVGTRQLRREDPRLLTGRGRFVADIKLPGMVEACFVRSSVAHARIAKLEYDFALGIEGVETVLDAADLGDIELFSQRHPELKHTPQRPLATGKVRFVGEAVAMIIARNRYVAEDALPTIAVDYVEFRRSLWHDRQYPPLPAPHHGRGRQSHAPLSPPDHRSPKALRRD